MTWKLIAALVVALASVSGAEAQNPGAQRSGDVAKALMNLENRWVEALVKADTTKLDAILADTYVDTNEEGQQADKRGVLAVLKAGDLKLASIKLSDMHVHPYGNSAIVTGMAKQTGAFKGESIAPRIVFTDTFVLLSGKWRVVASHRSAVHGP
jgi:uncharacterized protein DUF4440